jgi:hypothetical protein
VSSTKPLKETKPVQTPIDFIEDIISAQEWPYQRMSAEEMIVEIPGRWCDYRLHFFWQTDSHILHMSSYLDMQVNAQELTESYVLMALINQKLALGHFEISEDDPIPAYRYALLITEPKSLKSDYVEEIIEIALSECERFYPAFQFVILGHKSANEAISVALLDTAGEA